MKTFTATLAILLGSLFLLPIAVSAHVTVSPSEVAVGTRQKFVVNVPNEKDIPTVGVRIIVPAELESVSPYMKPGWEVSVVKTGEGENTKVTEITWKNGQVTRDMRDEFEFRAMVPAQAMTLTWKAYQTYSDGTTVAWDMAPSEEDSHGGDITPYSTTKVINDLVEDQNDSQSSFQQALPVISLLLSTAAVGISLASLYYSRRNN